MVDLHPAAGYSHAAIRSGILPAGYTDAQAMAIDAAGNIAGYANNHAFL